MKKPPMNSEVLTPPLKWNRRKEARPSEIINAAMDVFVENGFAAANLDDIAKRAGIAKGTLYRYFDTKEDLFRAAARQAMTGNLDAMAVATQNEQGPLKALLPLLLARATGKMGDSRVPAFARMVISESRAFPDLARIWHDDVAERVLDLVSGFIARAQARGEVRAGDPRLFAFSIMGPMVAATLFRDIFGSFSPNVPDMNALAAQHAETVLNGLLVSAEKPTPDKGRPL